MRAIEDRSEPFVRWHPDLRLIRGTDSLVAIEAPTIDELVSELMHAVELRVATGLIEPDLSKRGLRPDGEWDGSFTGYASTSDPDHDAWVIPVDSWTEGMGLYMRNPMGLFNHWNDQIVFKTAGFQQDGRGLRIQAQINLKNPFAAERAQEVRDGFLRAMSVGFLPIEEPKILEGKLVFGKVQLLEISLVSVPANPYALIDQRSAERVLRWGGERRQTPSDHGSVSSLSFTDDVRLRRIIAETIDQRLEALVRVRQQAVEAALGQLVIATRLEPPVIGDPGPGGGGGGGGGGAPAGGGETSGTEPGETGEGAPGERPTQPQPGATSPSGARPVSGPDVAVDTSPDNIDGHVHRIAVLYEDGTGETLTAGGSTFMQHLHLIRDWVVIPAEIGGYQSIHPGSLEPGKQV